jgi:hypothetical protein
MGAMFMAVGSSIALFLFDSVDGAIIVLLCED